LIVGLVGFTVLEHRCPLLNASHIVVWHLETALLCARAGTALSFLPDIASVLFGG
jgi:hypothetical protein